MPRKSAESRAADRAAAAAAGRAKELLEKKRGTQVDIARTLGCDQGALSNFLRTGHGISLGYFVQLLAEIQKRFGPGEVLYVTLGSAVLSDAPVDAAVARAAERSAQANQKREASRRSKDASDATKSKTKRARTG